ncbi:MAG: peptide chain release factor aRF-1 [Candidatus Woesearchaeota archaeon]|jgi:peptide chain release factor subunit 1
MALTAIDKHHLQKFIKNLKSKKARHTELISVLIPAGYEITKITQQLSDEAGTASNIKSSATRNNVIDALEKLIGHLRKYPRLPKNGLAAYSGNVSETEGSYDFLVTSIEPPMPMNQKIYRCDKDFKVEALEEMCMDDSVYGLVVMDNREANIALLQGKKIIPMVETTSAVPGKFKAGGQSAPRFMHIRENMANDFHNKIAHLMVETFLPVWNNLKGIIVGGPGIPKIKMLDCAEMSKQIREKIIAVKDVGYTGEFGLNELVDLSQDVLANEELADEKKIMQKYFNLLREKEKQVTYGKDATMKALELGIVDLVLMSDAVDETIFELFEEKAKLFGSAMRVISVDSREGFQLKEMGGIASILRYEYHG